jgi:ribosomal protein L16 Arg81 hydroxylase
MLAVHSETKRQKTPSAAKLHNVLAEVLGRYQDVALVILDSQDQGIASSGARSFVESHLPLEVAMLLAGCCDAFFGVDSCFLHYVDLCRIPGVALFGPTSPQRFGFRFSSGCRHLREPRGLRALEERAMMSVLGELLDETVEQERHETRLGDGSRLHGILARLQRDRSLMRECARLPAASLGAWMRSVEPGLTESETAALMPFPPAQREVRHRGRGRTAPADKGSRTPRSSSCSEPVVLEELVGSGCQAHFFQEHWQRAPLLVEREKRGARPLLLALDDLDSLLWLARRDPRHRLSLLRAAKPEGEADSYPLSELTLERFYSLAFAGEILCIDHVERTWPAIGRLAAGLREELWSELAADVVFLPSVRASLAPRASTVDTFLCCTSGDLELQVYSPINRSQLAFPQAPGWRALARDTALETCKSFRLQEGDVLYLPPLTPCDLTVAAEPGLLIQITVRPLSRLDLLRTLFELAADEHQELRAPLLGARGMVEEVDLQVVRELLTGGLDASRLAQALSRLWAQFADAATLPPDGHFQTVTAVDTIDQDTVLERRPGLLPFLETGDASVTLRFGQVGLLAPAAAEETLAEILERRRFSARQLSGPLSATSKLVLVRRLARNGLLRLAPRE